MGPLRRRPAPRFCAHGAAARARTHTVRSKHAPAGAPPRARAPDAPRTHGGGRPDRGASARVSSAAIGAPQRSLARPPPPHPPRSLEKGVRRSSNYNRWDRGLPGGTPVPTTIIICTTWCAHRYISRVRSAQVLIFYVPGSGYYHGRSCPICTRCFHRCSARIPTIPSMT